MTTVEYHDNTLVPAACLEEMIIKENSSEKLALHTLPLPSLFENDMAFGLQERVCTLPLDESMLPLKNQIYYTSKHLFEHIKLDERGEHVEIVVKFHCYSKFILKVSRL